MLKTIRSLNMPDPSRNNGSRSAFSINNNSKLAFEKNDSNSKVNKLSDHKNDMKYVKKSRKSSKSRKSKSEKISKSQNLAKSRKRLSKSENSTNSNTMENRLKFPTPNARTAFNCLWLAFTKAPIL